MSVLIKGMEMPKTCCQCDLKFYDPEKRWDENSIEQIGAWVCKRTREIIWNTQRGENCPLVEIPTPHGRLVDADAMIEGLMKCAKNPPAGDTEAAWFYLFSALFSAKIAEACPTIIDAEGVTE